MDRAGRSNRGRLRLVLTSSSIAALLVGGGAPAALALEMCSTTQNGGTVGSVSNGSAAGICILVENGADVTGNVTNQAGGILTPAGSGTGILITGSTIGGAISNAGAIYANATLENGIVVNNNAAVSGGIDNSGTISASAAGIFVENVSTFLGGISNSGLIAARTGIAVGAGVSSFFGGITNSGTIVDAIGGGGIRVGGTPENLIATFAGGISNSGTITGSFAGIYVDNVSNFSGGISNSGTITAIGYGIALAQEPVTISTFLGGISNSGLIAAGYGILVSQGVKSFFGGISNSGTILDSPGGFGIRVAGVGENFIATFAGGIGNSGSIIGNVAGISIDNISNFSGGISNSGMISGSEVGIQIGSAVGAVSTFSGSISNTGTISAATGIIVEASGPIGIFDSGVIDGTGGTAVDLRFNSSGNTFTLGPGFGITGNVLGHIGGGDTFQLGGSGYGSFDLSLIGSSQQYQNFTAFNVVGGVWDTSGTFDIGQPLTWSAMGGTLAGASTFGTNANPVSIAVAGGATLEPGAAATPSTPYGSPGTSMTITGNLAFQSSADYLINLNPQLASYATVSGTASLGGIVVGNVTPGSYSGGPNGTKYVIIDAGAIAGSFAGFESINAPGFAGTLTEVGDPQIVLQLVSNLSGTNQNQQNVAAVINNYFNNGGTLPADFFPLYEPNGGGLLSALDGEDATGAQTSSFQLMSEFLNLISGQGFGDGAGNAGQVFDYAPLVTKAGPLGPATFDQRWHAWGAGFGGGSFADGDSTTGSNAITATTYGYAGGLDYRPDPDTLYGFALAGGGLNWGLASNLGTGRSDSFQAGVYGRHYVGPAYIEGALAFGNNWFSTSRDALGEQLTASFQGQSYGVRFEGGYRYGFGPHGAIGVTPYAALQTQWLHTPAYSESGGALALAYNSKTANDTRSELGARFDDLTTLGNDQPVLLRARLAWAHDFVSTPSLGAAFESLPGSNFTVNGAPIPHDSALTSASAEWWLQPNLSLTAKFDGEFGSGAQIYAGTGELRYRW